MPKIPFSVYDFFGYLASGFLICVTLDYAVGDHWILRETLPVSYATFWIVVSYIVGHICATPSSWLYERLLVGRVLGRPNTVLFTKPDESVGRWGKVLRRVFPGYFTPLPGKLQERIKSRATVEGQTLQGETLFHHVRSKVKGHEVTWGNVQTFLHLYGFCRNISFALFVATGILLVALHWRLSLITLLGTVGMLYRYLKFHRQYSYEMFTTYPDLPERKPE